MNPVAGAEPSNQQSDRYDFVIIGSGFGGSVAAMRLSQKGYRVALLEAGKRWKKEDFPKSNWSLRKYFWAPRFGCYGIQRITLLKGVMVLHGSGVGGGSLVYANTLMQPDQSLFDDPAWDPSIDWKKELAPHYETARRMLGVTQNPRLFEGEEALRRVSERLGSGDSFHPTDVGVFFGAPNKTVPDPYFGGKGPERTGCNFCGGCMVGCRYGAKNTLDYNYLFFAEKWGAEVFPETTALQIVPESAGYRVLTKKTTAFLSRATSTFRATRVIVAAGVLGTVELLLRNRDQYGNLPRLSTKLGELVRTNGESLLGATSFEAHRDLSRGIAIGAAFHPNSLTKIEGVRYPSGSGAMRLLGVPLTGEGTRLTRPLKMLGGILRRFPKMVRLWRIRDWARSTLILLVMQSVDQHLRLKLGRSLFGLRFHGSPTDKPVPSYLPVAQHAALALAQEIGGEPQNIISEVVLNTPATAHILGGAVMARSPEEGVVDANNQVFGHPGLYVCDGSVIPGNLAVNPSLTITALAERFASHFPPAPQATPDLLADRDIPFVASLPSAG